MEGQDVLWIVTRIHVETHRRYTRKVFRTREAARKYAEVMAARVRAHRYVYAIDRATWGAEQ